MQPPPQATLGRLPKTAVFVAHAILYSKRPLTKRCEVSILPPHRCQIDGTWQKMIPSVWRPAFAALLEEMREIHWHKSANIKRRKKIKKSPNASLCVINGGFTDRKDVAVAEGKQWRGNNNAGGGQTVLAACVIIVYITVCQVRPYSCSLFLLSSPLQRFFCFPPKPWHPPSCLLWAHCAYLPSIAGLDAKRRKSSTPSNQYS